MRSTGGGGRVGQVPRAKSRTGQAERLRAVGLGVAEVRRRVTGQLGNQPTPEIVARLYAQAAVQADDEHGRTLGTIVQGDAVSWNELAEVRILLAGFADGAAHGAPGSWHPDCPGCDAATAYRKVSALLNTAR